MFRIINENGFESRVVETALDYFNLTGQPEFIPEQGHIPTSTVVISNGLQSLKDVRKEVQKDGSNLLVYYPNTPDNIQVYLDMDGVVSNFEKFFKGKFGAIRFDNMLPSELWKNIGTMLLKGEGVFSAFDALEYHKEMYNFFSQYNPIFLSSTGFSNHRIASNQKREWLDRNIKKDVPAIFTTTSKLKAHYAVPNSILIDDRPHSIMPWLGNHGEAIMHKEALDTIIKFKTLYRDVQDRQESSYN